MENSADVKIVSTKAINKTTVEVTFTKALTQEVTADNFKIQDGKVTAVKLSEDKKTATLTVEGLAYNTSYKLEVTGLAEETLTSEFTTPGIEKLWSLEIKPEPKELVADGISTGVIKFELHGEDGKIDTNANDVVLDLNSTYGFLSQKRVTIQNGTAEVILRSEFMANEVNAKIDAQVIEASNDYKDLIGKIFNSKNVKLVPKGSEGSGETVLLKTVKSANSNEADRVTLTFDEEVGPNDFYTVNSAGEPVLKGNVKVAQDKNFNNLKKVKGFLFDSNNKKVVTVILDKDGSSEDSPNNILSDNQDVYVETTMGDKSKAHTTKTQFKLADARIANITGVKEINNKILEVTFSEGVHSADFVIDGRFNSQHFTPTHGDVVWEDGQFVDYRNKAIIELKSEYQEPDKDEKGNLIYPAGYFKPGIHALEASSIKDFASLTDKNNIGQTQVLEFTVKEDKQQAFVSQVVDSPEQFRVNFDKDVQFQEYKEDKDGNFIAKTPGKTFSEVMEFQVWDAKAQQGAGEWVKVTEQYFTKATNIDNAKSKLANGEFLKVTPLNKDNKVAQSNDKVVAYKLETTADWTHVYDTENTKDNHYNDKFRVVLPKGTVVTSANGKFNNEAIELTLSSVDGKTTVLGKPDVTSPVIKADGINRIKENGKFTNKFTVDLTEPVKLNVNGIDGAGATLAQGQAALPDTKVEFIGKDKDGKTRTLTGKALGYANAIDNKLIVEWDTDSGKDTPQTIVNQEGNTHTEWTLVIKSLSDDIGNTVPTATQTFELQKDVKEQVEGVFRVSPTAGSAVGEDGLTSTYAVKGIKDTTNDFIEITYTEAVAINGLGSATNVKNYTFNGAELPTGSSIALAPNKSGNDKVDNKVIIKLPKDTLKLNATNIISLAGQISSKDGKALEYDKAFTLKVYKAEAAKASDNLNSMTNLQVVEQAQLKQTLVAFEKPTTGDLANAHGLGLELLNASGEVIEVISLDKKDLNNKEIYSVKMLTEKYKAATIINVIAI